MGDGEVLSEKLNATIIFNAYLSSDQSISNSTFEKIQFDSENFDVGSDFDASTNNDFTAPTAGKYYFSAGVTLGDSSSGTQFILELEKNGSQYQQLGRNHSSASKFLQLSGSTILDLAKNDTVTIHAFQDSGGSLNIQGQSHLTWFAGYFLGA